MTGGRPFPWQLALLRRFLDGDLPRSLDIPTGLGKTAVMAIWLVARAAGAAVPRRLVYVVDRRAVVDQATRIAEGLRDWVASTPDVAAALDLGDRRLPISTLRGRFVDNREWLEDPAAPAIVVGTVDMVGSRLLFEGYGLTRKIRPYQAAMLGCDALFTIDEAHLVPPFERLLEAAVGTPRFRPRDAADDVLVPRSRLLTMSATGRAHDSAVFGLGEPDLLDPVVQRRLGARKRVRLVPIGGRKLPEVLAAEAFRLSGDSTRPIRCVIFTDRPGDAEAARKEFLRLAGGGRPKAAATVDTELLVGGRRVFERQDAAAWLARTGFVAGAAVERSRPAFLFATSAGEVGVDLDADHMVSDLVAWERMVQRLGRVNRRGDGEAEVVVVDVPDDAPSKKESSRRRPGKPKAGAVPLADPALARSRATRELLGRLPRGADGAGDGSPRALGELRLRAAGDDRLRALLDQATTPAPLHPELTRPLLDAWAMTSLPEHTGRPEVEPWLRGWVKEAHQATVLWRRHLPIREDGRERTPEVERFFEAAPPHVSELLETESFRIAAWLGARAAAVPQGPARSEAVAGALGRESVVAIHLDSAGEDARVLRLWQLELPDRRAVERLERKLRRRTIVIDARLGGLDAGRLSDDAGCEGLPTLDGDSWIDAGASQVSPSVRYRVRRLKAPAPAIEDENWRERFRVPLHHAPDGEVAEWLSVEKWRHDAATEEDRSSGPPQLLAEHEALAEELATALADRLGLPDPYRELLAVAARLHDEGKAAPRWQKAFRAPAGGVYAKTHGPVDFALLDGYRHELASLARMEEHPRFRALPPDLQDLALHVVAAHHGFARPLVGTSGCDDAPPSVIEVRARAIALRFAGLLRQWGPWGLAYWETLLRAADVQASRRNELAARREGA